MKTDLATLKIPQSWSEVTIQRFIDSYFAAKGEYEDNIDAMAAMLSALTGESVETILGLSPADFVKAVAMVGFTGDYSGLSTRWPTRFVVGGKAFSPLQKLNRITAGQEIFFRNVCKRGEENIIRNLHNLLAEITRPCGFAGIPRKLKPGEKEEIALLFFQSATVDIIYPMAVYFLNLYESFLKVINESLLTQMEKEIK